MNFLWIDSFLETAKQRSFTKAARSLHLAQQTVSKYVMNLEEYLGVGLIDRGTPDMSLTPAGKYYASLFAAAEQKLDCLSRRMAAPEYSALSIGMSEYLDPLGEVVFAIRDFVTEHPEMELEIVSLPNEELTERLMSGQLDAMLISEGQLTQLSGMEAAPVAPERLCLYGPACVVGAGVAPEVKKRRTELPYLIKEGQCSSFEISAFCRQEMDSVENAPERTVVLPNIITLKDVVEHGGGLAVCDSRFGFMHAPESMGMEPLDVESDLCCCYLSSNDNPAVPGLVSWLKVRLEEKT